MTSIPVHLANGTHHPHRYSCRNHVARLWVNRLRSVRAPGRLLRVLDSDAHLRELPVRARALPRIPELPPRGQRPPEWAADHRDPCA